jgi:hypothetical protein
MVEPPWTILPARRSATAARAIASQSSAPCCQKRRSSMAIVALRNQGEIRPRATGSRCRVTGTMPSGEPLAE